MSRFCCWVGPSRLLDGFLLDIADESTPVFSASEFDILLDEDDDDDFHEEEDEDESDEDDDIDEEEETPQKGSDSKGTKRKRPPRRMRTMTKLAARSPVLLYYLNFLNTYNYYEVSFFGTSL